MKTRMQSLQQELTKCKKKNQRLQNRLDLHMKENGVTVTEDFHEDMKQMMHETESQMIQNSPSSFMKIFWKQQLEAASKNDARGMRWHPLMIKWCVYLCHLSQKAHDTLKQTKCIFLPSKRTLRDFTHCIKPNFGFSNEVDLQLVRTSNINGCDERDKQVLLLIDEMHVKEDLVYDKHTGKIIGLINMSDINSQLLAFESRMRDSDTEDMMRLANSVTTIMIKGLFKTRISICKFPMQRYHW